MIHELIDAKKKTNKSSSTKNPKLFQEPKPNFEEINLEASDSENKESSNIFIPPWLRNSLGLNQRNNLRQGGPVSDQKSTKFFQKTKDGHQNEFESLKGNLEKELCCKKAPDHTEIPRSHPQKEYIYQDSDDCDINAIPKTPKHQNSVDWELKLKESESEWIHRNPEAQYKKETSRMASFDVSSSAEIGKLKFEEEKRQRLREKSRKKRHTSNSEQKQFDLEKNEVDTLLETKARQALSDYMKADEHLDVTDLHLNNSSLYEEDVRALQEMKERVGNVEEGGRVSEHVKEVRVIRNPNLLIRSPPERKWVEKEEKHTRDLKKTKVLRDSLMSTDDENDIKRFSEFLNTNKNVEEKKKCLEEVRNYFERKRQARQIKHRFFEEEKPMLSSESERNEETPRQHRSKPSHRGRKSKFALCGEEVVEKALDEALQKFIEMYNFRVSPTLMGSMKRNILQALKTDILESSSSRQKKSETIAPDGKIIEPEMGDNEPIQAQICSIQVNVTKHSNEEDPENENLVQNCVEQGPLVATKDRGVEDEKLKRLKKEFDSFLNSVRFHTDVTKLTLQSIILEEEDEKCSFSQNAQFVYNFSKKSFEPEIPHPKPPLQDVLESTRQRDIEIQSFPELEPPRRHSKTSCAKSSCDKMVGTDEKGFECHSTQTGGSGITLREIKDLRSSDITPGLYRMIRSKEEGKFYLYPEHSEDSHGSVRGNSTCSVVRDKKLRKKRHLANVLSKERRKERQVFFKERESAQLKRSRKSPVGSSTRCRRKEGESKNPINCLYFRNVGRKNFESLSSRREFERENMPKQLDAGGEQVGRNRNEQHLGCFWFWNGEKITPGCDLKIHVESLLSEKLSQFTHIKSRPKDLANPTVLENGEVRHSEKILDVRDPNAIFCFSDAKKLTKETIATFAEDENNLTEEVKKEETASQSKSVKSVGIQSSNFRLLSLSLSKMKRSSTATILKRKCGRRNVVLKPPQRNMRKTEDIKSIEKLKNEDFELPYSQKGKSSDSESFEGQNTFTSGEKNERKEIRREFGREADDSLTLALELNGTSETQDVYSSENKDKSSESLKIVESGSPTNESYDLEDASSGAIQETKIAPNGPDHLNLIKNLLIKFNKREKETLWNGVRDFVKTKIGKDINDEGTREVCIEIEQDVPETEQGKMKRSVLAKGHYTKNEGDIEVEIDLTLEDLARILRQRRRRIRKGNLSRGGKFKNLSSGSSTNSDVGEGLRRYQWYLNKFAALGEDLAQNKEPKLFKKAN